MQLLNSYMSLAGRQMGKIPIRYLDPKGFLGEHGPMGNAIICSGSY